MNKINLMNNLIIDPFAIDPKEARKKTRKFWPSKKTKKEEPEIKTIVMCGCGNHSINPMKDPYIQHNKWVTQFHRGIESGVTNIQNIKGIEKVSTPKPTYDFSGEEFEVTPEELRRNKK
jgi:hypothetical protein